MPRLQSNGANWFWEKLSECVVNRDGCYLELAVKFIHTATGGGGLVGHELESCTTEISITKFQCPERSDLDILFVDTPGFDDTNKSDVEILDMIAEWLKTTWV
jgi:hypothetical protein